MKLNHVIAKRENKAIYHEGDFAVKLFDSDFKKSDVLNEALNQSRVEETTLAIPKIDKVTKIEDKWAIVSEFIEGETLAELMDKNPEKEDEYLELFINLQISVHSKRVADLNRLKEKMNTKISACADILPATTRYELHTRLESLPVENKVCHGDFTPSNIIITKDGTPYIIDWSHATQGNSCADVARTFLRFCLTDKQARGEKYLNLFCAKSDTAKQQIQKWMPIVAAGQLSKGRKNQQEFLLNWINVFDYE